MARPEIVRYVRIALYDTYQAQPEVVPQLVHL